MRRPMTSAACRSSAVGCGNEEGSGGTNSSEGSGKMGSSSSMDGSSIGWLNSKSDMFPPIVESGRARGRERGCRLSSYVSMERGIWVGLERSVKAARMKAEGERGTSPACFAGEASRPLPRAERARWGLLG
jgi:hypothetical protein